MRYQVGTPLPCERRVLLEGFSQEENSAGMAFSADFTDKNGRTLAPLLADMAQRGGGVLLLNLAADTLSVWLAREQTALLAQGVGALCRAAACSEVVVCVPQTRDSGGTEMMLQDEHTQLVCEALAAKGLAPQLRKVPASPVLREETALYQALDTGTVRVHPMCKAFLSEGWQHRPCCVVDAETACAAFAAAQGKTRTKLIAVRTADSETATVREVPLGTALSEICSLEDSGKGAHDAGGANAPGSDNQNCAENTAQSAAQKPALLGEQPGVFADAQALAEEHAAFCWRHDAVTLHTAAACMADCAAKQLQAAAAQSCHNCVLCREGSWHLEGIFTAATQGKAKRDDLALVEDIAPIIADGTLCLFGRTLAQTALSAVQTQAVRTELEAHIVKKTCPAGVCASFSGYVILPDKCTGCGDCLDACEEDAIEGKDGFIHMIDPDLCEKCGKCAAACEESAIVRSAEKIRVPKKLTRVGRFS